MLLNNIIAIIDEHLAGTLEMFQGYIPGCRCRPSTYFGEAPYTYVLLTLIREFLLVIIEMKSALSQGKLLAFLESDQTDYGRQEFVNKYTRRAWDSETFSREIFV